MSTAILGPTIITLHIEGTAGELATTDKAVVRMPFGGTISSATAAVSTAPTGSALTADILVGTATAASFSIAAAGTSAVATLNNPTKSVTNKALTSNVATLTAAAHGFAVGNVVSVVGVGSPFDGAHTITTVASANTFAFAKTNANITSVASTGGKATSNTVKFNEGDLVTLDVTGVGSTVDGGGLTVAVAVYQG